MMNDLLSNYAGARLPYSPHTFDTHPETLGSEHTLKAPLKILCPMVRMLNSIRANDILV